MTSLKRSRASLTNHKCNFKIKITTPEDIMNYVDELLKKEIDKALDEGRQDDAIKFKLAYEILLNIEPLEGRLAIKDIGNFIHTNLNNLHEAMNKARIIDAEKNPKSQASKKVSA